MSEIMTLPTPPQRKCAIGEVFEASFIELLQLVPANPFVRAWVLKFCGKMPPEDCVTFDQLQGWVEFNCIKRVRSNPQHRSRSDDGIGITVRFSETEHGRCHYQVDRSGEDTFQIGQEELLIIVQDAIDEGGAMSAVVDAIASRVDDDAWNECDPDMDSYEDYDHEDYESNNSDNAEINYSRDQIENRVLGFLQNHHPELAAQL